MTTSTTFEIRVRREFRANGWNIANDHVIHEASARVTCRGPAAAARFGQEVVAAVYAQGGHGTVRSSIHRVRDGQAEYGTVAEEAQERRRVFFRGRR